VGDGVGQRRKVDTAESSHECGGLTRVPPSTFYFYLFTFTFFLVLLPDGAERRWDVMRPALFLTLAANAALR
jgi:hypothetical protein